MKLDAAVQRFGREAELEGFNTPEGAEGCCEVASRAFLSMLEQRGVEATLVCLTAMELEDYPVATDGCLIHYVVEVAGRWFDWTARQFDPDAAFPTVTEAGRQGRAL